MNGVRHQFFASYEKFIILVLGFPLKLKIYIRTTYFVLTFYSTYISDAFEVQAKLR